MTSSVAIITPTWKRPALLVHCILQVKAQLLLQGITALHMVVSDGPDEQAKAICGHYGVQYAELEEHVGDFGKSCLDVGIIATESEYLVFWDDDNVYHPHSIQMMYAVARGFDMGVIQVAFWDRPSNKMRTIPEVWRGYFESGHIDTANVMVRRQFLLESNWTPATVAPDHYDADFHLWERTRQLDASVHFEPYILITHI